MKKFISIAMASAVAVLFCVNSVGAVSYNKPLFEEEFNEYISESYGQSQSCNYEEMYYHYEESGNIDWCLISAYESAEPGICHGVFDDIIISDAGSIYPFSFGLGVYDVTNDEFYDICNAWDMDFAQLHESFYNVMTDDNSSYNYGKVIIIGDVDRNGKLDVNDVSLMQQYFADITPKDDELDFNFSTLSYGINIKYISDCDKDGKCDVKDVTCLQYKIAK